MRTFGGWSCLPYGPLGTGVARHVGLWGLQLPARQPFRHRYDQYTGDTELSVLCYRLAVASMKEKEVADFLISPDYAFGPMGCPPRIPPAATLRYKVDLKKFWATTELDSYQRLSRVSEWAK